MLYQECLSFLQTLPMPRNANYVKGDSSCTPTPQEKLESQMKVIVEKDLRRWKLACNADGQVDSAIFWRAAQQSSANLLCVYPMSLQSHACTRLRKFTPVCKRRYTRMHPSSLWEQAIGVRPSHIQGKDRATVLGACHGGCKNETFIQLHEYVMLWRREKPKQKEIQSPRQIGRAHV